MIRSRNFEKLAIVAIILAILIVFVFYRLDFIKGEYTEPLYSEKLFDDSYVHNIDIDIEDIASILKDGKEEYRLADVTIDGERFEDVGFRIKGNNSRRLIAEYGLIRYSFKLEFDHYVLNDYYGLDKLSLDASFQDNSYLKTYLAYDMMAHMGIKTPLLSFTELSFNGAYFGMYLAIEEMEEAFLDRNFGREHGVLYKPDYRYMSDDNTDLYLGYIDDDIASYPNIFDHAKVKVDDADKRRVIEALKALAEGDDLASYIDILEVIDYFVISVFVMNWDSYIGHTGHNYYLYEEDGKIAILPWDYNLAFGTYALGMGEPIRDTNIIVNWPIDTPCVGEVMLRRPLYHELMKVYIADYHDRFAYFLNSYFGSGKYQKTFIEAAKLIEPYVKGDPSAFVSYEDHLLALKTLDELITARVISIAGQLNGEYPIKLKDYDHIGVDVSDVAISDLGDFEDLRKAKAHHDELLRRLEGDGIDF